METLTPRQVSSCRGLPASRHTSLRTILPPNTPRPPIDAFTRYPSARWVSPHGGKASPLASRLAGYVKPNRVRHPADWSLTSGCSPPRLAATQLPSVSRPESVCLERICTSIRVRSRAHQPRATPWVSGDRKYRCGLKGRATLPRGSMPLPSARRPSRNFSSAPLQAADPMGPAMLR